MADNLLVQQPNGMWAKLRALDPGDGVLIPVVSGPYLTPEQFGAKGDGVTNDTSPFQTALNALPEGGVLMLRDGATYLVDNLIHPTRNNRGVGIKSLGIATIKSSGIGDSNYLLASNSYANNLTFVTWALNMENIVIDAGGTKDIGLALSTINSRIINCRFTGANLYGCYLTETTIDGVTNCPSVVDNAFIQCIFDRNLGTGLGVSDLVTDYQIYGGNSYFNGLYDLDFASSAGLQMSLFTTYTNGPNGGARFGRYGFSTNISGCIFDGPVEIATLDGTNQNCQFGPGNTIKDHELICTLGGAGSPVFLSIVDCRFQGVNARVLHNFNSPERVVFLEGGSSEDVNPVRWVSAAPTGTVIASGHWSKAANGFLNGRLWPMPNTFVGATACNTPTSVAKNLTAGTTTDVVITLALPTSQYSGSALRVKLSVLTVQNAFADVETYTGIVDAAFYRRTGSAITGSHAVVRDENSSAGSGISAAAAWSVVGGAGDQVATLTITVTHVAPSATGPTVLRAEVDAEHRYATAMTMV
jgi:hypothetical protein